MSKGNDSSYGNSAYNGAGSFLRYDPLFAQIYFERASFWKEIEP